MMCLIMRRVLLGDDERQTGFSATDKKDEHVSWYRDKIGD